MTGARDAWQQLAERHNFAREAALFLREIVREVVLVVVVEESFKAFDSRVLDWVWRDEGKDSLKERERIRNVREQTPCLTIGAGVIKIGCHVRHVAMDVQVEVGEVAKPVVEIDRIAGGIEDIHERLEGNKRRLRVIGHESTRGMVRVRGQGATSK